MKLRTIGYVAVIAITAAAFVIGSAMPSDAKSKKKKAEAAPPPPTACFMVASGPVCATKGGLKFTYKNSCYAAKDGASAVQPGPCKAAKAKKAGKKKGGKKPTKK